MFYKTKLKNGLRVVVVQKKESLSTTLLILVNAGTNFEEKQVNGLSHFVEHMFFKGTKLRPRAIDISSEMDSLGADFNAFTSREYTGYYVCILPDKVDNAFDILSDMFLNSVFDEQEIEKEKGVINEEINRAMDNPSREVQEIFNDLMYGDSPYGRSTLGSKDTVMKITRNDFLEYCKKYYHTENVVVIAAGNIDKEAALEKIERYFQGVPKGKGKPKQKLKENQENPALRIKYKKGLQTNFMLGFRGLPTRSKDYMTGEVLAGILGGTMSSRLFQKIREEMGAAYAIGSAQTAWSDYGYFYVYGGVQSRLLKEVLRVTVAELIKLKTELVSETELAKVKDSIIGSTYLGLETPQELAAFYGGQEIRGEKILMPKEFGEKVKSVTAKQVRMLAQKIFQSKTINLAVLGPHKMSKEFVDILTL